MTDIEGELAEPSTELVPAQTVVGTVKVFSPLDAEPAAFTKMLVARSENYDALALHLRAMLVPGKDFGRIHVAGKQTCSRPWECSPAAKPGHWSGYMLFAPGADKVLGILGLASSYPGEQDFIRAALSGKDIQDVIMKCNLVSCGDTVVSEGMGACSRSEVKGSLNNAIKRACKRARLDAVLRLPSISALFEDDFLEELDRQAKNNNSTSSRARQVNTKFTTGATLDKWPLKGKLEGQRFADMEEHTLDWILRTFEDKPDIYNAALRVREKLNGALASDHPRAPRPAAQHQATTTDEYNDYPEAQ